MPRLPFALTHVIDLQAREAQGQLRAMSHANASLPECRQGPREGKLVRSPRLQRSPWAGRHRQRLLVPAQGPGAFLLLWSPFIDMECH